MLLINEIHQYGSSISEYEAKLFGGGNMFPSMAGFGTASVGERNVEAAYALLKRFGLRCVAADLGGNGYRNIAFDLATGIVRLRRSASGPDPAPCNDLDCGSKCQPR